MRYLLLTKCFQQKLHFEPKIYSKNNIIISLFLSCSLFSNLKTGSRGFSTYLTAKPPTPVTRPRLRQKPTDLENADKFEGLTRMPNKRPRQSPRKRRGRNRGRRRGRGPKGIKGKVNRGVRRRMNKLGRVVKSVIGEKFGGQTINIQQQINLNSCHLQMGHQEGWVVMIGKDSKRP